jgi:hypothetical protein
MKSEVELVLVKNRSKFHPLVDFDPRKDKLVGLIFQHPIRNWPPGTWLIHKALARISKRSSKAATQNLE